MTLSRSLFSTSLTANDEFKLRYPRYLKGAVLAALALTALFVWLWPGYEAKPYRLRQEQVMEIIEIEPLANVDEPPIPVEVPRIPPEIEAAPHDDPDAVDTIPDLMPIDTLYRNDTLPPPSDEGFLPSSAQPVLQFQMKAAYPEIARRAGLEGTVVIQALVDVHGRVDRAEVIQGVHPLLDKAAQAAALRCKFTPAKQRDFAVPVWVAIPYRFRLR
jgi:protein TonB